MAYPSRKADELFVAKYLNATASEPFLVSHLGDGSEDDLVDARVQAQAQALVRWVTSTSKQKGQRSLAFHLFAHPGRRI